MKCVPAELINKKIHFIGIGGCGMSGLAVYLYLNGVNVSGSDCRESPFLSSVRAVGIDAYTGHDLSRMPQCDLVVITPAVKPDNAELQKAMRCNIPVIRRGEFLGQVLKMRKVVAIAGAHGKTSTAALLTWILNTAGHKPSALIGGIMENFNASFIVQHGELVVTEADESDGSIQWLEPEVGIILNIDDDHIEHYSSQEDMNLHYRKFVSQTNKVCIANYSDPILRTWNASKILHFGQEKSFHVEAKTVNYNSQGVSFTLMYQQDPVQRVFLPVPGRFFIDNFLAALTASRVMGVSIEHAVQAVQTFAGVKRRGQEWMNDGVRIIEDYAHHPTEIKAILTLYSQCYKGKIACVFQPHRFSRSKHIAPFLADAFKNADELIITDVYSADEAPIEGVNGEFVFEHIRKRRTNSCQFIPKLTDIVEFLEINKDAYDLIIFMGAGSVGSLAEKLRTKLNTVMA